MTRDRRWLALLTPVILFAFAARAIDLGAEPLWVDESFSFALADAPLLSGPVALVASDVHPPLYFVLLGFWTRLAGYTEFAGRYFSALAGVLAVALTYALGRRLFSARAGLWAAVALSVAGLHVRYAREIRMYALLALLSAAATLAYVRWRARPTQRRALVYVGLAAALPYTHYYGALVPLAHLAHFAVTGLAARRAAHRPPWRGWLLMQGGAALAFAPWLPVMLHQLALRPAGIHHAAPSTPHTLEWVVSMLTDDLAWLVAGLVVAGVLGVFAVRGGQRVRTGLGVALALLWIAVPVAAAFVVNAGVPSLTARNLIAVTPALALAVGLGLSRLRALGLVAGALLVFNALTVFPHLYPGNPPWPDFVRAVAAQVHPGDVMLYHMGPNPRWEPFEYYRRREPGFPVEPVSLFDLPGPPSAPAFTSALEALVRDEPRVWVVTTYETPISWYALQQLTQTHHLSARMALIDTNAYLFEPPPAAPRGFRLGDVFTVQPEVRSAPPYRPGDAFEVMLHWETNRAPEADYSVGLHLVNEAFGLSAQSDAYPEPRTSTWRAGAARQTTHRLTLPADLPAGRYDVHLVVYTWWDAARLPVQDAATRLPLGDYILLDTLVIEK